MTLFQDLGPGGKDMSDKQIGDFVLFGSDYGPGIPQFFLWIQKPGW
jgi:hypothetical protein